GECDQGQDGADATDHARKNGTWAAYLRDQAKSGNEHEQVRDVGIDQDLERPLKGGHLVFDDRCSAGMKREVVTRPPRCTLPVEPGKQLCQRGRLAVSDPGLGGLVGATDEPVS